MIPTVDDAADAVSRCLGTTVRSITRFPTGLAHYVYDVRASDGRKIVVRMGTAEQSEDFRSARYWHGLLAPRGVPLPRLLACEVGPPDGSFPFMIMERLPGSDLHAAYPGLSSDEKRSLARCMATIQRTVGTLPPGPGFGYARSYHDPSLHVIWPDVLRADLARNRSRIEAAGIVDPGYVERVTALLPRFLPYLAAVEPLPFLDDTTTKNVIVHHGRLSGIVDVDVICFGDPLLTIGLTQMALLSARYDTDYIRYWEHDLELDPERARIVTLYTAIFCVNFLGEIGHWFNRDTPLPADADHIAHLMSVLEDLLSGL